MRGHGLSPDAHDAGSSQPTDSCFHVYPSPPRLGGTDWSDGRLAGHGHPLENAPGGLHVAVDSPAGSLPIAPSRGLQQPTHRGHRSGGALRATGDSSARTRPDPAQTDADCPYRQGGCERERHADPHAGLRAPAGLKMLSHHQLTPFYDSRICRWDRRRRHISQSWLWRRVDAVRTTSSRSRGWLRLTLLQPALGTG